MSNLGSLKRLISASVVIENKAMRKLRISAISFLNTAPLVWDFEHGERAKELAKEFAISYTVPSLCADALRKGEADIGIIPAITYQTIPDLFVIPDIAIAARGPVRSILLVSKAPVKDIRSVAVDTSSRTSVALLEILFRKGWLAKEDYSKIPTMAPTEPDLEKMLATNDAALLIGDSALRVDRSKYRVIDLAEAWHNATGKPFVFAFWAIRKEALATFGDAGRLSAVFAQSRDQGLQHVGELANQWAGKIGISQSEIRHYLTRSIHYSLEQHATAGLSLFFDLASEFAIVPARREVEFAAQTLAAFPPR